MLMTGEVGPVAIASDDLEAIRSLYDEGLFLRRYERARRFGPLRQWGGTEARTLAGRLALHRFIIDSATTLCFATVSYRLLEKLFVRVKGRLR